jgi:hypothetical protein
VSNPCQILAGGPDCFIGPCRIALTTVERGRDDDRRDASAADVDLELVPTFVRSIGRRTSPMFFRRNGAGLPEVTVPTCRSPTKAG